MEDVLHFNNAFHLDKGASRECRLVVKPQNIIYKNLKTGRQVSVQSSSIKTISWYRASIKYGLRVHTEEGHLHKFTGLNSDDYEKIKQYVRRHYQRELEDVELNLKGGNHFMHEFNGQSIVMKSEGKMVFEIPLDAVRDCSSSKNEVFFSFLVDEDAVLQQCEMRFHFPGGAESAKEFVEEVLRRAPNLTGKITGSSLVTFGELLMLTPRGRYEIKLFPTLIQLHGKSHDHKINVSSVLRLFQLLHKDGRQAFFVIALDPPIVQGQTRYQFLQFVFSLDEESTITLDLEEEELKEKYEGKLTKTMSGSTIEIFANILKATTNKRINVPDYKNLTNSAITCSYKNNAGLLYPLERGFIYVHKPAIHVRFEEISSVNFARSDGSTRSFDLEIEIKSGSTLIFNSIEKEEYPRMYDYITKKKLRIKNRPNSKTTTNEIVDDLIDSDDEDAYLARVKNEGRAREQGDGEDSEEEDEDFDPNAAGSDSSSGADSEDDDDFESDDASDESDESGKKRKSSEKAPKAKKKAEAKPATGKSAPKPKPEIDSQSNSSQGKFKSREFIDDNDSSSSD